MSKKATIIAVVNQKGGTGKTTTTENLGVGLALEGKKVLLVDTDPQASLTVSLGNPCPDDLSPTLSDLMGKIMMESPIALGEGILHHPEGVDLVPSNIELSGMEVALVNAMSRETILRQYLDTVKQNYDYILLDCMPSLGMLTVNALAAADNVLIPVQAAYLPAKGLEQLLGTINKVKRQINPKLRIEGILLTMVDNRTNYSKDISNLIRESYGGKLKVLEAALRNEINNIERTHSGYDEYRYDLDEINHNPYELAAYLTVKFEDYTRDEVQATLQWLFEQQYELTLTEVVEIRTRTTSSTDPETGETTTEEEDYEYYILKVKLRNKGLDSVISNSGLSEDDMERYRILLQIRGNRQDIFGNDIYATPGGEYTDYDIPGEALTDTRFANMIREAEKYLGYPYVWGGSSPSTSFDCSGFVSWVINNCGNGWSVGRLTANGLMGVCDIIPRSSAKPGDLIFFQGTYDTSGASHVGIYVGNGMMIHCGNPISYASIETSYWQQHFYCFGRIRN